MLATAEIDTDTLLTRCVIPDEACSSTTNPVGLSSVDGPLWPQITQSYRTSESRGSADPISITASVSGDSIKHKIKQNSQTNKQKKIIQSTSETGRSQDFPSSKRATKELPTNTLQHLKAPKVWRLFQNIGSKLMLPFKQILCIPYSGEHWQNEFREMLITNNSISFDNVKYCKTNLFNQIKTAH